VVYGIIAALGKQKLLVIAILKIDEMRQIAGNVATYGRIEDVQDKLSGMARNIAAADAALSAEKTKLPRLALPPVELSCPPDNSTGGSARSDTRGEHHPWRQVRGVPPDGER
jgi:hypothetical protein